MLNKQDSQEILNTLKFMRRELELHNPSYFLSFSSELSKFNELISKLENRELILVDTKVLKENLKYEEEKRKFMNIQNIHKINAYIKVGAEANLEDFLAKDEDYVKSVKERLYYSLLKVLEV